MYLYLHDICTCALCRSARVWKIIEETQLVFEGKVEDDSLDCISLVNEQHFVTGSTSGHLAVWGVMKKRPLARLKHAHGDNVSIFFVLFCIFVILMYSLYVVYNSFAYEDNAENNECTTVVGYSSNFYGCCCFVHHACVKNSG